jgi:hypothetical protein
MFHPLLELFLLALIPINHTKVLLDLLSHFLAYLRAFLDLKLNSLSYFFGLPEYLDLQIGLLPLIKLGRGLTLYVQVVNFVLILVQLDARLPGSLLIQTVKRSLAFMAHVRVVVALSQLPIVLLVGEELRLSGQKTDPGVMDFLADNRLGLRGREPIASLLSCWGILHCFKSE